MANNQPDLDQWLHDGIVAVQRGDRERGQALLLQVVEQNSEVEAAWWWLSFAVENLDDQITAVQNVLALNPRHAEAQHRLEELRAAPTTAAPEWKSLLPEAPQEDTDEVVDNPFQCPYCGRITAEAVRRCPHCGKGLWRRVQTSRGSASFQLLRLVWAIAIAFALVDALAPMFAVSLAQDKGLGLGLKGVQGVFGVSAFFGNFAGLPLDTAQWLVAAQLTRAGLLFAIIFGLSLHWASAYYLALFALVADVPWNVFLLFNGYLGVIGAAVALVLAVALLVLMFACAPEFPINDERILVRPDGVARSALDFYMLGHRYRKRGMWALAVMQWRRAAGLAPTMAPYYKDLGIGYAQINRFERSLRALKQAQREAPEDVSTAELITLVAERQAAHQAAKKK